MSMNDIFPLNVSILLIVMYFLIILTSKILSSNYLAVHILFESVILISVLIDEFGQQIKLFFELVHSKITNKILELVLDRFFTVAFVLLF